MRRGEVLPLDGVKWAVRVRKEVGSSGLAEVDHLYPEMKKVVNCPYCERKPVGTGPCPLSSKSALLHLGSHTVKYT